MPRNQWGEVFCVTTFGESHGPALGVVIDGCPGAISFDEALLQEELARRRPGDFGGASGSVVSQRKEGDRAEVLSGVFEGKTLGTPLTIITRNRGQRPGDYAGILHQPRRGHADDLWQAKWGHWDHRGGGRSSGRETVARVMAGAVAEMVLAQALPTLRVVAYASQIGPFKLPPLRAKPTRREVDSFPARFPWVEQSAAVAGLLAKALEEGESYGGRVRLVIEGLPSGLGQPVFHKLKADLGSALLSIGGSCEVTIGEGNRGPEEEGTVFHSPSRDPYGGIRGGISTGDPLFLTLGFKPPATVLDEAKRGRHDPCIVPRVVPVVEAMAKLVLVDHWLWRQTDGLLG